MFIYKWSQQFVWAVNIMIVFIFNWNFSLKKKKGEKFNPHLFQCWDNLHQDFTNSLDVGADAKDALCFTRQGKATHSRWGWGASKASKEEGNNISDQRIPTSPYLPKINQN